MPEVRPTPQNPEGLNEEKEVKMNRIKDALMKRFGKIAQLNPETGQMDISQASSLEDPRVRRSMMYNCNEVSQLVQGEISGERYVLQARGEDPNLTYEDKEIASGHESAFHAFVVDKDRKVWDPIVDEWGDTDLDTYLDTLQAHNVSSEKSVSLAVE